MGSLGEHGCSRITLIGGVKPVYLKQFLACDMSEKCFFFKCFFPEVNSPYYLAVGKAFSFNL
jgi:hypothetical protein